MADFSITETTRRKIGSYRKLITLEAGGKLTDEATLVAIAGKTVPAGYEIDVDIRIIIQDIRVV